MEASRKEYGELSRRKNLQEKPQDLNGFARMASVRTRKGKVVLRIRIHNRIEDEPWFEDGAIVSVSISHGKNLCGGNLSSGGGTRHIQTIDEHSIERSSISERIFR